MQVDPGYPVVSAVDPTLAFRDFQRLIPKHDELLSNVACFGLKCAVRHYTTGTAHNSTFADNYSPAAAASAISIGGALQLDPKLTPC